MSQTSRSYQSAAGHRSVTVGTDGCSPRSGTFSRRSALRSYDSRWYTTVKSLGGCPWRFERSRSSMPATSHNVR